MGLLVVSVVLVRWCFMLCAAVHDVRTRTFPNGAAFAFVLLCGAEAFLSTTWQPSLFYAHAGELVQGVFSIGGGLRQLLTNALIAGVVFVALFGFELIWRRACKQPGIGIGDLKFLFALMLVDPAPALFAFVIGLIAMSVAGLVSQNRSLPLLPFIVPAYAVVSLSVL